MSECDEIDYERHAIEAEVAARAADSDEARQSFLKIAELMRQLRAVIARHEMH